MVSGEKEPQVREHEVLWEDVPLFLDAHRQQILSLMQRVNAEKEKNDENMLYSQCLAKAGELTELFSQAWGTNLPLGCAATRCMFELDLLVRLFEVEPATRMKFCYSWLWEERDLWEAFLSVDPSSSAGVSLRERIKQLNALERHHRLVKGRDYVMLNWAQLAKRFNVEKDYKTIYRWSSKTIHITPFSVLGMGPMLAKPEQEELTWRTLLLKIQLYSGDLSQRLSGLLRLEIR